MRNYHRLTRMERYQIDALLRSKHKVRFIARTLNRSPSTVSREIRRTTDSLDKLYSPRGAHERALRGRHSKRPQARKIQGELKEYIETKLKEDWSPEQIAGRLSRQRSKKSKPLICFLSIYRFIYFEALYSGSTLYLHLRSQRKRRKKQQKLGLNLLKLFDLKSRNSNSIDTRPKIVDRRNRCGDFERDLIRGVDRKGFVLTAVDRASRLTRLANLPEKNALATHKATVQILSDLGPIRTITNDNGSEFFEYDQTSKELSTQIYFAHPYSSWERGTIENTNGLIRQYLPKNMDFTVITPEVLAHIENRLNSRPRKCLRYLTPSEMDNTLRKKAGVALAM